MEENKSEDKLEEMKKAFAAFALQVGIKLSDIKGLLAKIEKNTAPKTISIDTSDFTKANDTSDFHETQS